MTYGPPIATSVREATDQVTTGASPFGLTMCPFVKRTCKERCWLLKGNYDDWRLQDMCFAFVCCVTGGRNRTRRHWGLLDLRSAPKFYRTIEALARLSPGDRRKHPPKRVASGGFILYLDCVFEYPKEASHFWGPLCVKLVLRSMYCMCSQLCFFRMVLSMCVNPSRGDTLIGQ